MEKMNMSDLILIRGIPGSGKTTLANYISNTEGFVHLEADMYFIDDEGNYEYLEDQAEEAHNWCIEQTRKHLRDGMQVVVSNTFIRPWELRKYADLEPTCKVIECTGEFNSCHGVPDDILESMIRRFAPREDILNSYPEIQYEIKAPEFYG